jgi:hypothetical protein
MAKKAAKKSAVKKAKAPVKAAAKIKNLKPKAVSASKAKAVKGGITDTFIKIESKIAPTLTQPALSTLKVAPTTTQFKF